MDPDNVDPADVDPTNISPSEEETTGQDADQDEGPELDWFRDNDVPIPPRS